MADEGRRNVGNRKERLRDYASFPELSRSPERAKACRRQWRIKAGEAPEIARSAETARLCEFPGRGIGAERAQWAKQRSGASETERSACTTIQFPGVPPNPPFGPSAARSRWKNHRKERSTKDLRASNIHGKDGRATHSLFPFRFLFPTLRSKETLGCCPNPPEGFQPSDSHLRFARMKLTLQSPQKANLPPNKKAELTFDQLCFL